MWLLELLSWTGLGLTIALGRCFFSDDYRGASRTFLGAAFFAILFGAVSRIALTQSVLQRMEFSWMSVIFAALGTVSFLTLEWLWKREQPTLRP